MYHARVTLPDIRPALRRRSDEEVVVIDEEVVDVVEVS